MARLMPIDRASLSRLSKFSPFLGIEPQWAWSLEAIGRRVSLKHIAFRLGEDYCLKLVEVDENLARWAETTTEKLTGDAKKAKLRNL
jgi:hypothetical protein